MFRRNQKEHARVLKQANHLDYPLLITVFILVIVGLLMVYSGSAIVAVRQGNEPYFYFIRQLTWVAIGTVAGYFMYRIDYHIIAKFALPSLIVSIMLLVAVLLVNQGQDIKRWIDLGPFPLQPSELTKFTFLLYLSSWLSKHREKRDINKKEIVHHIKHELLPFILVLGLVCALIVVQPDLDTMFMLGVTSFVVYFLSGSDIIHTIGSIATAFISGIVVLLTTISASYRMERLQTFIDFWKNNSVSDPFGAGYQFRQVLIAVASGGFWGVGFTASKQKYHYLGDTAFSDTIFAIFAEENGMFGGLLLVAAFVFFFLRGYKIAMAAKDKLGYLIAISITTWLTLQAILHIGSNVALLPINGNTLPFMSYGGSSTIVNLMAIGLLLNVAKSANFSQSARIKAEPIKKTAIVRRRSR